MANAFLNLYIQVTQAYQKNSSRFPPDLQQDIAILTAFLQTF